MRETDTNSAAERARAGVRAWIRDAGRRTKARVRSASPYAIFAFLTASAVAPIAGAGLGAPSEFSAALDQLGGVGSNFLSDALAGTARRLRESGPRATEEQWRDAIAADLLPRLAAADEQGRALHEEISRVLREVDAVGTAISEAALTDEDLRHDLEAAFQELGAGVGELHWMLADVRESVDGLRQQLAVQSLSLHQQLAEVRRHLVAFTREQLPADDRVPADVPPGAVPPYPGLASFQPEDAPWFRGREPQVAELLGRLAEQAVGGPPLVITGVSGAGKSSLVRAGLLPGIAGGTLGTEAAAWPWVLTTPGVRPLADLERRLRALADVDGEKPLRLRELASRAAAEGRRPVIVVDQFEELFTQCPDPAERLAYATALTDAAPALVVIAVRSDFYPACVELPPLARVLAAGHVVLGPLDAGAIRRAVVEPAEQAGLGVEPGLPDLLLRDLGAGERDGYEPGALPLLAHALRATWDLREGARLTVEAYRATGGIRHAIAETAERIYLELPDEDRERLRDALLALVTVTSNGTVVRRRGERAAADSRVLRRLVRARLVTVGAETVEISHEALLSSWPRLAGWLAEAREDLLLRQQVTEAARDWERSDRDPDLLLRGSRLLAARERVPGDGVPPVVGEYLAAGWAAAEREEEARRRTTRRLRRLAAGLGVALLLAVGGGLFALDQQGKAEDRRLESLSRQYAAESVNALMWDQPLAVRQALEAWQEAPTAEARGALLSARMVSLAGRLGTEPGGVSAAVSPDGSLIAIGHMDGTIRFWDAVSLKPAGEPLSIAQPKKDKPTFVASLAFSPDGRFLASGAYASPGVQVWDVAGRRALHTLGAAGAVAWLPDSETLVASRNVEVGDQFQLGLWDAAGGRLIRSVPTGDYLAMELAISPDGRHVAMSEDHEKPARVWRLNDGRAVTSIPDTVRLAFAPDGSLVGGDQRGLLTHWAIPSGRKLRQLNSPADVAGSSRIAVTGDGVVIGRDSATSISSWELTGTAKETMISGYGAVDAIAVSTNGQLVVATGHNQPTVVFRRATNWLPNDGNVRDLAFSPDGRRLATAGDSGRVRIWDATSSQLLTVFDVDGTPEAAAYAPDGTLVVATGRTATGTGSRAAQLRTPDNRVVATVPLTGDPMDLAISPDGSLLAVVTGPAVAEIGTGGTPPNELLLYDLRQRRTIKKLTLKDSSYAVTFSADGATLLASITHDDLRSKLWSWRASDLTLIGSHEVGGYQVLDLAAAPDGSSLAVTGTNHVVDVRTPDGSRSLWKTPRHFARIGRVAFAPDGRTLASSDAGGAVKLWDTATGRLAATLSGHTDNAISVTFSPDGRSLASSAYDGTTAVWRLDTEAAIRELCTMTRQQGDNGPLPALCR